RSLILTLLLSAKKKLHDCLLSIALQKIRSKNRLIFITAGLIILLSNFYAYPAPQPDYCWPVEIQGTISGNFGESRFTHFHAGLDITTNQTTGYKLYAIANGYVYRLKASAGGYGKALYLKLDDGRIVVYGHCKKFIAPVEQYLNKSQHKMGSYEIDLYLDKNMFRFNRGDVIAFSGKSGDVAPHLHIELRDKNDEPINILSHGLTLPYGDKTTPTIKHLAVKPVGINSWVDENLQQLIYYPRQISKSNYVIDEPIKVWGQIGLKLNSADTDNTKRFHLAVYTISLKINQRKIFNVAFDKFNYSYDYYNNFLAYDRELKYMVSNKIKGDYLRLFVLPETNLALYKSSKNNNGYLFCGDTDFTQKTNYLNPGYHAVAIEVKDQAGNTATLHLTLDVEPPKILRNQFVVSQRETSKKVKLIPQINIYDSFFSLLINANPQPQHLPVVEIKGNGDSLSPKYTIIRSPNQYEYVFEPLRDISKLKKLYVYYDEKNRKTQIMDLPFNINYIPPSGGKILSEDRMMSIKIDRNNRAVLPAFIQSMEKNKNIVFSPNLHKLSGVYRINPMGFELSKSALLKYHISKSKKLSGLPALFEWIDNKWRLLPRLKTESSYSIAAKIDHFAAYAVFTDGTAPVIKFQSPQKNYAFLQKNDTIVCKVRDEGVGIAYKSVKMSLNGKNIPAEYRLDTNSLFYKLNNSLPQGKNLINVSASDRLGNKISKQIWFVIQ
ncbi:M23 family metallopeptidase, partial [bacterium]|nr:M23 family metallopeptidase [bacterium]